MTDDATSSKPEIVIVRRRSGDDAAGGKGGAWKIAYADFVTAMMAFFLVMWLINASNEETRAQVASYFNPIKLTDSTTGAKGLRDPKDNKRPGSPTPPAGGDASTSEMKREAELLLDPVQVLESVRPDKPPGPEEASLQESSDGPAESVSGHGMHDPFEPGLSPARAQSDDDRKEVAPPGDENEATEGQSAETAGSSPQSREASLPPVVSPPTLPTPPDKEPLPNGSGERDGQAEHSNDADARLRSQNEQLAALLSEIASKLDMDERQLLSSLDLKWTSEGLLISMIETHTVEMFKTGSAEPEPQLVRLVDAVASALSARAGYVVVRGHTDSRPYRNKRYDNWQLSTARAHFVQYMLMEAGLDEDRIRRVEGWADRSPRNMQDPEAPENRRIEILLGVDPP